MSSSSPWTCRPLCLVMFLTSIPYPVSLPSFAAYCSMKPLHPGQSLGLLYPIESPIATSCHAAPVLAGEDVAGLADAFVDAVAIAGPEGTVLALLSVAVALGDSVGSAVTIAALADVVAADAVGSDSAAEPWTVGPAWHPAVTTLKASVAIRRTAAKLAIKSPLAA